MNDFIEVPRDAVANELARVTEVLRADELWNGDCEQRLAEAEVLANSEFVYVGYTYIGSVGTLVERASGRVVVLGSGVSFETYAWALAKGVRLNTPNTLVITKVHDRDATIEVMKAAYTARYVRHEIAPFLAKLPLKIELDWPATALLLGALRPTQAFDYEVNP